MERLIRYMMVIVVSSLVLLGVSLPGWTQTTTVTPDSVNITLFKTELSTDGSTWITVFDDPGGTPQDLMNSPAFGSGSIDTGTYNRIRFDIGDQLSWSAATDPCGGGPVSGALDFNTADPLFSGTVYFATADQNGAPNNSGWGASDPLLLSQPIVVGAGGTTDVDLIFGFSNAVECMSGTPGLNAPTIFVASADAPASGLSGTYNVVAYQVHNDGAGDWGYTSFWGDLYFNGSGVWTANLTSSEQTIGTGGSASISGDTYTGMYGLNRDGTMWMTVNEVYATLMGGISSGGNAFAATVLDGLDYNMIFYGLKQPTGLFNSNVFNGTYAFDGYYASYDVSTDTLEYGLTIGDLTFTPQPGNTVNLSGFSGGNFLVVSNPTVSPTYGGGPQYLPPFDPISDDNFTVNSDGTCVTSTGDIWCTGLSDGSTGIYAANIQDPSDRQEFGVLIRQSSSLGNTDLSGTYFGAFFGDEYSLGPPESDIYYSGSFVVQFDGTSNAAAQVMMNEGGTLETSSETASYTVNPDGKVSINDTVTGEAIFEGQLSGDGEVLLFYSPLETSPGSVNNRRELGMMVKLP